MIEKYKDEREFLIYAMKQQHINKTKIRTSEVVQFK